MRAYTAQARAIALSALEYRLNVLLGMVAYLVQLVALLAVWRVLLAQSPVEGFTWPQMQAYLLVAFASGALVSINGDFRMAFRILQGTVALDLVKPVDYQRSRFAEALGGLWIEVLIVIVACAGVGFALGGISVPAGPALALFAISMLLLVPLKFLILYLTSLVCFWTQNYMGVQWARIAVVNLLSGALIPLVYLPDWLGTLAKWSPFAGLTSTPALIYIGRVDLGEGALLVAVQLGWVVVLWFGARLLWRSAVRQLTVNGG
ncbi:ABC-2 family transporter protein [Actinoplanes sp. NPDC051470]|uniref:ABC transporter permease n=1 Tax=unclassified Actinoplanes TaxID=2626549 RepID=UPI003421B9F3